jgi:hypothetical protein
LTPVLRADHERDAVELPQHLALFAPVR